MADITPRKITLNELKVLVDSELESAMGYMDSELSDQRSEAMDRYLGEPLGNEMEGRSQVQTRDVIETIEWIMPTLIRIFTDKDRAVEFRPVGPEDEEQAEQETEYSNYLFYEKSNGFLILYSWFKDALLSKVGIVKSYVEENEETCKQTYEGITDEGLAILAGDGYEILEKDTENGIHKVVVTKTEMEKDYCTEVIPPEEFLISTDANSIDPTNARFCAHRTTKTISDLREMGFSDDDIGDMDIGSSEIELSEERLSRMNLAGEERFDMDTVNMAMRKVRWNECYTRVDMDGDGKAELLKVFYSGQFIEYEEINYHPFDTLTPIILTHKFFGLSIADLISDIQEIRTSLFRSYFDNIHQLINGRTFYDKNTVNLDDMLTSKPFGLVENNGPPGQAVLIDRPSGLPAEAYTLNEMLDKFLHSRVGDFQTQVDPNVLAQANTGVVIKMLNEAKSKVEMIARIFAEVGVKELFKTRHYLIRTYADKEDRFRLRNEWVPVNPSEWKERKDFKVNVGLGTQDDMEKLANIEGEIETQLAMMQSGVPVLLPDNLYLALEERAKLKGLNPQKFWSPPQLVQQMTPPPPPDPSMEILKVQFEAEQMKAQVQQEKNQLESQGKIMELQLKNQELQLKAQESENKSLLQILEARRKQDETEAKIFEMQRKGDETAISKAMEMSETSSSQFMEQQKLALEAYKVELNAGIELLKSQAVQQERTEKVIAEILANLSDMKEPESQDIEYDSEGRIVRIGKKRVNRDTTGRAVGINRL